MSKNLNGMFLEGFNPQTEGMHMASTNLETSPFLQFPIEKKFIRIGAPKKKKYVLFTILNLFINERDCGRDHRCLNCSKRNRWISWTTTGLQVPFPKGREKEKHAAVFLLKEDSQLSLAPRRIY